MYFSQSFFPIDEQKIVTCSKFSGTANYRSKNRGAILEGANYRSKICNELSRTTNYHLKIHADRNNRHHKNAGKFPQNVVSSEISSSQEKPGILSKFACIAFAQYCTMFSGINFFKKYRNPNSVVTFVQKENYANTGKLQLHALRNFMYRLANYH